MVYGRTTCPSHVHYSWPTLYHLLSFALNGCVQSRQVVYISVMRTHLCMIIPKPLQSISTFQKICNLPFHPPGVLFMCTTSSDMPPDTGHNRDLATLQILRLL